MQFGSMQALHMGIIKCNLKIRMNIFSKSVILVCFVIAIEGCVDIFKFIATDIVHHPKDTFMSTITATNVDCATQCHWKIGCTFFYHNTNSNQCFMASDTYIYEADTSVTESPENTFQKYTKPVNTYASCLELKILNEDNTDGEYQFRPLILPPGKTIQVYCADMASTPVEFLTLPQVNSGDYPSTCNLNCNGEQTSGCPGSATPGHVDYTKIRLNIHTLKVDRTDKRFASGTGDLLDYGSAGDCYNELWGAQAGPTYPCGPKGTFSMNIAGTGLVFDSGTSWVEDGWKVWHKVDYSPDLTSVAVLCGGWCGRVDPDFIKLGLPPCMPKTCVEVQTLGGFDTDDHYWLYPTSVGGAKVKVYCHDMDTGTPTEYITLPTPNKGVHPPQCNLGCNGDKTSGCPSGCAGTDGTMTYQKARVDIDTMEVVRTDRTFTTKTGAGNHDYGQAKDCYNELWGQPTDPALPCGPRGSFNVDSTGTGLRFNDQTVWTPSGWQAKAFIVWSADQTTVGVYCGGWSGGCQPDFMRFELNPAEQLPTLEAVSFYCD